MCLFHFKLGLWNSARRFQTASKFHMQFDNPVTAGGFGIASFDDAQVRRARLLTSPSPGSSARAAP